MTHSDIKTQLINQGIKESPLLLVERKFELFQKYGEQAATAKGNRLLGIQAEGEKLVKQINEICDSRKIGNPLKGEKVEYIGIEYVVEYYEELTSKFKAIEVRCDSPAFADVEAMKRGARILKVSKIYEKNDKEKKNVFHPIKNN